MRHLTLVPLLLCLAAASCDQHPSKLPSASGETLKLSRVYLYRNGIGYFEREGQVAGSVLRLKVRKDQVNDLLKSLTVVRRSGGQAVSVSMPLDPQSWANAALATLAPGRGNLAQVLDALRGTRVALKTRDASARGRIVMVEKLEEAAERGADAKSGARPPMVDHQVTLMDNAEMRVVRLSRVTGITLEDGDLAMQFHRSLDATAGEGMFQQVEVAIRLTGAVQHDLVVSYVVPAPMWKPTYRVVLPPSGKGQALLQGWAVVDNTTGEDWREVKLALTSGAPIAFRYDLHTPRDVDRADITETGVSKRASVSVGESTYKAEEAPPAPPVGSPAPAAPAFAGAMPAEAAAPEAEAYAAADKATRNGGGGGGRGPAGAAGGTKYDRAKDAKKAAAPKPSRGYATAAASVGAPAAPPPAVSYDALRQSTLARVRAAAASGLTRFDLEQPVTVPDGTSTMVAIVNAGVEGEETFLFKPGGAGIGYESNPYRVVRFKNATPFVLESGPIAIYAGGSFVGEGISEAVGAATSATIPFAVEPGILVASTYKQDPEEMRLLRIVRGVLEVETFARRTTKWTVKAQTKKDGFTVLVRHPRTGYGYELATRPKGTEDLPDAYLVPIEVAAGKLEGTIDVTEQTPSRTSISIWDGRAASLLEKLLVTSLSPQDRQRLEPIVQKRVEIGRIDTKIEGLKAQQVELDQRANETRQNLNAIKKDAAAAPLRARLSKRLEQFTQDGDRIGREVVDLQSKRLERKIELDDMLQDFDLRAPEAAAPAAPVKR
jgi:hypothetical protein